MTNIVERLRNPIMTIEAVGNAAFGVGRAVVDIDRALADMKEAANEIEYLRSLTGPVSRGGNFADIAAGVLAGKPKLPEVS